MDEQRPLDLLEKFLQGKCTAEEERIILEWYGSLGRGRLTVADPSEQEEMRKQRIYSAVQNGIKKEQGFPRVKGGVRKVYLAAAAITILISFVSVYLLVGPAQIGEYQLSDATPVVEHINNTNRDLGYSLPDGSLVTLSPGAVISYPEVFSASSREVILIGEAFFDVRRDTLRPFRVHTREVTTHVLGTSFTIRAVPDKPVEVIVRSGKVMVYKGHDAGVHHDAVVLTPNQQVSYQREEGTLVQSVASEPVALTAEPPASEFENLPVGDVLRKLTAMYAINIRTDNGNILTCPITASFNKHSLYSRIEMICKALGATYTVNETEIIIHGGTCE